MLIVTSEKLLSYGVKSNCLFCLSMSFIFQSCIDHDLADESLVRYLLNLTSCKLSNEKKLISILKNLGCSWTTENHSTLGRTHSSAKPMVLTVYCLLIFSQSTTDSVHDSVRTLPNDKRHIWDNVFGCYWFGLFKEARKNLWIRSFCNFWIWHISIIHVLVIFKIYPISKQNMSTT